MGAFAKRIATYSDLMALPPHVVGELLMGNLVTHPRPTPRHSLAHMALGGIITQGYQFGSGGPDGVIILTEPELHLAENVTVPDLAGWRRERLVPFPETAWIETPPDWICEVISDSTEMYDRHDKRIIYPAAGVKFLWLLDPRVKLLECFSVLNGKWVLHGVFLENETVSAEPFEQVPFALGNLWPAVQDPNPGFSE